MTDNLMKSMKRMTVTIQQKIGTIDKTIDKQFEEESRRFKSTSTKTEALYKEAKTYLDSIRALTSLQHRIAEAITNFYDEGALLALCGLKFKDASENVDSTIRVALDNELRVTVIEPIGRFIGLFPDVNDAIKRREGLMLDYDELRTKVKKLVQTPSQDPTKLPMGEGTPNLTQTETKCNEAKLLYDTINQTLTEEIPRLINSRVAYIDPILVAFVRTQHKFYRDSAAVLQPLTKYFGPEVGEITEAEGRVNQALQQMRDLSIVRIAAPPKPPSST